MTYADDSIAAGTLTELKVLWNILYDLGPKLGYYPRSSKSWRIDKKKNRNIGSSMFFKTWKMNITSNGKKHFGAVNGSVKQKTSKVITLKIR